MDNGVFTSFSTEFQAIAQKAVRQSLTNLRESTPHLSVPVLKWLATHCDTDKPEEYFVHPNALTMLSLPWWLEQSINGRVDAAFQMRLMESSTSLYYFARMLDDLMDGHPTENAALPALYPFLLNFQGIYLEYFSPTNGFWGHFRRYMREIAEVTSAEVIVQQFNEESFVKLAARKTIAALVPIAAVCYHYDRLDLLEPWESYFCIFGCWHQFRDDLHDWSDDAQRGIHTWLLSEAERCKRPDESVAMWMGREGFDWAGQRLARWMGEMKEKASRLNSPELLNYLDFRDRNCTAEVAFMTRSAAAWARLLELAPTNG